MGNSIGTDEEVKHYPTQKIANTKAEWAAMSSEQELSWCGVIRSRFVDDEAWRFTKRNFASQDAQDWLLFSSMFRNMEGGGVYVDLAANDPRWISNTFLLDRCVGWTGLCIEADPKHARNLRARRKCKVFEGCIWNVSQEMTFEFNNGSGAAGLQGHNKLENFRQESTPRKMVCSTLQHELERNDIQHVDYLSLDIEGAEIEAMKGVDFGKTRIDVITAETNGPRGQLLIDILEGKGFVNLFKKFGFKLNLDHVFIHRDAADKLQWFHCKLYEVYPFVYINYLMSIKK